MPETKDRQRFDRGRSPMRWFRTYWPYFVSAATFLQFVVPIGIGRLGDVDTACAVAGRSPGECGSGPVTAFLLNPPAWFLAISFMLALAFFALGERKRQNAATQRASSALEGEWALYKQAVEGFDDRVLAIENDLKAILETLEPVAARLDRLEAAVLSQGKKVEALEGFFAGLNQEVKTNKKAAEDRSVSDFEVIQRAVVGPVEERIAKMEGKIVGRP